MPKKKTNEVVKHGGTAELRYEYDMAQKNLINARTPESFKVAMAKRNTAAKAARAGGCVI